MNDERSPDPLDAIITQIVIPIAGLALTYWVGTHAATIEIEIRSRWAKFQNAMRRDRPIGVAEWFVRQEAPKVIEAAEEITRGEA